MIWLAGDDAEVADMLGWARASLVCDPLIPVWLISFASRLS
jgi:hypothetical protein